MHGLAILGELAVVLGAAASVTFVLRRLKLPVLVGYLVAGALIGPGALHLVPDASAVRTLADVGVVLLLFSIGVELSLSRLMALGVSFVIGGALQVGVTTAAAAGIAMALGLAPGPALVVGFVVSLSSTALVLRALSDAGELETRHGRLALALLLFQDLAVVPMTLLVPVLGGGEAGTRSLLPALLEAVAVVAGVLLVARRLVPWLLDHLAATRSRELFLIAVAALVLGIGWLTTAAGLSMALGAFLAGLAIGESEHRLTVLSEAVPFRDLFIALFFVAVGMLLDPRALVADPAPILGTALAILLGKAAVVFVLALALGQGPGTATRTGLALAQVGEFSFVLLTVASGVLPPRVQQSLLAATVLSMGLTPLVLGVAPRLARAADRSALARRLGRPPSGGPGARGLADHVIVAGFGPAGRQVAAALAARGVAHVVVELNAATARRERRAGTTVVLGDVTRPEVLHHAGLEAARSLVLTLPDAETTRRALAAARRLAPGVRRVARTRYQAEVEGLRRLGADEVLAEEHLVAAALADAATGVVQSAG
jgi:CPA2 family monovalent cation:H+ antiporter-2